MSGSYQSNYQTCISTYYLSTAATYPCLTFNLIAAGKSSDGSSSGFDVSVLRLSLGLPFRVNAVIKTNSDKCARKDDTITRELVLSFGFSEIVGRLSIGFEAAKYELLVLSQKFTAGEGERRYVGSKVIRSHLIDGIK